MNKTKINAQIIGDSICPRGHRITTYLLTYPRIIHAELLTHRMFSRNAASSRAIPFNTMVKTIEEDPFIPIAWQKDHKGMQGTEYFTSDIDIEANEIKWNAAKERAIKTAISLHDLGVTKQLCNRLLEPFMWTTVLVTATEWENFFNLRCPQYKFFNYGYNKNLYFKSKKEYKEFIAAYKSDLLNEINSYNDMDWLQANIGQSEIHMMALAEAMWDARAESKPKQLSYGEWHIPFEDKIDIDELGDILDKEGVKYTRKIQTEGKIKVATSMAARTSYTVVGNEKEFTYENHIALHDRLISQVPLHASPMEHCAKVPTYYEYQNNHKGTLYKVNYVEESEEKVIYDVEFNKADFGWFDNFHGFIPYRKILENETNTNIY